MAVTARRTAPGLRHRRMRLQKLAPSSDLPLFWASSRQHSATKSWKRRVLGSSYKARTRSTGDSCLPRRVCLSPSTNVTCLVGRHPKRRTVRIVRWRSGLVPSGLGRDLPLEALQLPQASTLAVYRPGTSMVAPSRASHRGQLLLRLAYLSSVLRRPTSHTELMSRVPKPHHRQRTLLPR